MTTTTETTITILDAGRATEVRARIDGETVRLPADSVKAALGWDVEPDGLCRDGVCMPIPAGVTLDPNGVDLETLASVLGRPLAVDAAAHAACLGFSAAERAHTLASLRAPDFTLPDLDGRLHSLSDHRGKKIFLVAYASW